MREACELREVREARELRESSESRELRESSESRELRESSESRELRELRESSGTTKHTKHTKKRRCRVSLTPGFHSTRLFAQSLGAQKSECPITRHPRLVTRLLATRDSSPLTKDQVCGESATRWRRVGCDTAFPPVAAASIPRLAGVRDANPDA